MKSLRTLALGLALTGCNAFENTDLDGDGVPSEMGWFQDEPAGGLDCDDYNAHRYPGAPDVCDGIQNDCTTDAGREDLYLVGLATKEGVDAAGKEMYGDDYEGEWIPAYEDLDRDGAINTEAPDLYTCALDSNNFDENGVLKQAPPYIHDEDSLGQKAFPADCDDQDSETKPDPADTHYNYVTLETDDVKNFDGKDNNCNGVTDGGIKTQAPKSVQDALANMGYSIPAAVLLFESIRKGDPDREYDPVKHNLVPRHALGLLRSALDNEEAEPYVKAIFNNADSAVRGDLQKWVLSEIEKIGIEDETDARNVRDKLIQLKSYLQVADLDGKEAAFLEELIQQELRDEGCLEDGQSLDNIDLNIAYTMTPQMWWNEECDQSTEGTPRDTNLPACDSSWAFVEEYFYNALQREWSAQCESTEDELRDPEAYGPSFYRKGAWSPGMALDETAEAHPRADYPEGVYEAASQSASKTGAGEWRLHRDEAVAWQRASAEYGLKRDTLIALLDLRIKAIEESFGLQAPQRSKSDEGRKSDSGSRKKIKNLGQ